MAKTLPAGTPADYPKTGMMEHIIHPFDPVYDENSRVLILGTMASPASRKAGFYYGHPQNRFWRIMGDLFSQSTPRTNDERITFCHCHHIALWDVLKSCDIKGADDGSIRNATAQPIAELLKIVPVQAVFTTGRKAYDLYRQLVYPASKMEAILLPSTSPANCRFYTYEALLKAYERIIPYCSDLGSL